MNDTNLQASSDAATTDLQEQVRSLRSLLTTSLAIVFIFTVCVNIFLIPQSRMVKAQADEAEKTIGQYQSNIAPWANDFWNKLLAYSKTHPDFNPIIEKYRPYIVAAPQGASTSAAPKK